MCSCDYLSFHYSLQIETCFYVLDAEIIMLLELGEDPNDVKSYFSLANSLKTI